jgi:hypothetical protein
MIWKFCKALFLVFFSCNALAFSISTDSTKATETTDTIAEKPSSKHILMAETSFGSNSVFFGRANATKLPFASAGLTYSFNRNFYISFTNSTILSGTEGMSFQDVSTGFSKNLTDKLTGSISYTRFFFGAESFLLQSSTTNLADAFLSYDWNFLYTTAGVMTIFGGVNDYFLVINNSRYFGIDSVFSKKDIVSFEPSFGIIAGTQSFATLGTETTADGAAPPSGKRPGKKPGNGTTNTETSGDINPSRFNILSYELNLPVTYTINNFSLELNWKYIIPVNVTQGAPAFNLSVFTASMYYIFRNKKK